EPREVLMLSVVTPEPESTAPQSVILDDPYLTVAQGADIAQVCDETIRRWIKSEELRATRVGASYRFRKSKLIACLDRHTGPRQLSAVDKEAQRIRMRRAVQARWEKYREAKALGIVRT